MSQSVFGVGFSRDAAERQTTEYSTPSVASGVEVSGFIALSHSYRILRFGTTSPARARFYTTTAQRTADAARPIGTDPTGNHGLQLEFVTTSTNLVFDCAPTIDGFNGEDPPTIYIPFLLANLDTVSRIITVTVEWIATE